jgi:hypothetical protein
MRTYELRIRYDESCLLKPGLRWKRCRSGVGYCLDTPGESFLVVPPRPLENDYLCDLQVMISPTWDVVDEYPPTILIPSREDCARSVLLLAKSEISGVELGKLIQKPFDDLADVDPNTVYGQMEEPTCGLFILEFGLTRHFSLNKRKVTIRVEKESGKPIVS